MENEHLTLSVEEARFVHEVLSTPGLSLPLQDPEKLILAGTVRRTIGDFVKRFEPEKA